MGYNATTGVFTPIDTQKMAAQIARMRDSIPGGGGPGEFKAKVEVSLLDIHILLHTFSGFLAEVDRLNAVYALGGSRPEGSA